MATPLHEKEFAADEKVKLPRPFVLRRLHSLLGVWLVVYLFEHLLINSQMALYFDDDGSGFISLVNKIHNLPYLKAIEILFLGLPFVLHGIWGLMYLRTAKLNAHRTSGATPSLPQYKRNRSYSWQRITSWLLILGILAHVVHMRFLEYPAHIQLGETRTYFTTLPYTPALARVAETLDVSLYTEAELEKKVHEVALEKAMNTAPSVALQEQEEWLETAQKKALKPGEVLAAAPSAGAAFFLIVRQAFKSPLLVILYSILVVAAVYHAFNGLWTFLITWGITLSHRSQKRMRVITTTLMGIVMFIGLLSAWGTYWTTQFQQ